MAYSDFTLRQVTKQFNLTFDESRDLFDHIAPVPPSALLQMLLADSEPLALALQTEKARSEFLIAPILLEIKRAKNGQVSLFSGQEFSVEPSQGLAGICDFLLSRSPEQWLLSAPIITVVEAKNENIKAGVGQCVAEMVAVQKFNEREQKVTPIVYGAVTTGDIWKFLQLEGAAVSLDKAQYYTDRLDAILGILLYMVS